jgi:hypothetical protein
VVLTVAWQADAGSGESVTCAQAKPCNSESMGLGDRNYGIYAAVWRCNAAYATDNDSECWVGMI